MVVCLRCQKRNPDGSTSCQFCGRPILQAARPAPPPAAARAAFTPPEGPARTSGMAGGSLALGILGLFTVGLTALPGLILGVVGLRQIDRSEGALRGRGLAISGIVISGLVLTSLVFIAPLAAILFPVFAQARERARATVCMGNLQRVGMAMTMYAQDYDDHLPPARTWCDSVTPYLSAPASRSTQSMFTCPSLGTHTGGQAYNARLSSVSLRRISFPQQTVLAFDGRGGWNVAGGPESMAPRHNQGLYVLFADGRVQWRRPFEKARWEPAPAAVPRAKRARRRGRR
jgi:prepilin-type processing-associated H-X9-DG protein